MPGDTGGVLSTVPYGGGEGGARRRRALRRTCFAAFTLFLLLGVLGWLGPRTREASAGGGGVELTVSYPAINRPGLAAKVELEVRRSGGIGEPTTLALNSSYLDALAEVTVDPEPATSTSDAERTIWTFDPPPGSDTLVVSIQGRIHPSGRIGRPAGTVELLDDGAPVVSVRFRTLVVP